MEIWDAVCDEQLDLAEHLADLDEEHWNAPSLCSGWRIRDVAAHVVAGAEGAFGAGAIVKGMLLHGFNFNRWVAVDGRARGRQDPELIVTALRIVAADRNAPAGARPVTSLAHVLIHGQDVCRPLGLERDLPEGHLVPVAEFVREDRHRFGAKRRIAGLKLTATDVEWSCGNGPEVSGPAEALIMMMAGRSVALNDLSGEGKAVLVARAEAPRARSPWSRRVPTRPPIADR